MQQTAKSEALEETAARLFKENNCQCLNTEQMDFLYSLQGKILHGARNQEWAVAVTVFNSLPEYGRRFAYQNYRRIKDLVADRKDYSLKAKK